MGLFSRLTRKPGPAPAEHTRPAPVAPDLEPYAASRGLDYRGTRFQPGFEAVQLGRDENERNIVRGTLPGGEHGVLFHEWATFDLEGAGYPSTLPEPEVATTLGDRLSALDMWLDFDPTGFVDRYKSVPPVRAAFTTAAVLVPEATAPVGRLRIDRSVSFPPYDFAHGGPLDALGLPGWHARAEPQLDAELFSRFADGGVRAAALAGRTAQPFATALPPPAAGAGHLWEPAVAALAARLRLAREDPLELHRALPSLPVPGQALAVLRGALPGIAGTARLVLATGRPAEGWNIGRNAVLLPVRPGLPQTPVEGVVEREAQLRWHVAGDYAAFHSYRTGGAADVGDVDGLIARAAALARERGLVG